jgi:hypothetical protein
MVTLAWPGGEAGRGARVADLLAKRQACRDGYDTLPHGGLGWRKRHAPALPQPPGALGLGSTSPLKWRQLKLKCWEDTQ